MSHLGIYKRDFENLVFLHFKIIYRINSPKNEIQSLSTNHHADVKSGEVLFVHRNH